MSDLNPHLGTWITKNVAACAYPSTSDDLSALAKSGVSLLINLHTRAHGSDELRAAGLAQLHLSTQDFTPPTLENLRRGVAAIEEADKSGRTVAVHCGAGLGRTGTLVACYLVKCGMSAENAMRRVRELRPGSIETDEQEEVIRVFEKQLPRKS